MSICQADKSHGNQTSQGVLMVLHSVQHCGVVVVCARVEVGQFVSGGEWTGLVDLEDPLYKSLRRKLTTASLG